MAGEIKKFRDINNTDHKVDITGVEGLQTALGGKADISHEHTIIQSGSASVSITGSGDNKQVSINGDGVTGNLVDSTPTANSNKLIKSSGVAAALAGKLGSSVTEKQVAVGYTTIDVDTLNAGSLYLVENNLHEQVSNIFICDEDHYLHFHLNSGTLTNTYLMVRVYNWNDDGEIHHFVEVVGAWN